MFSAREHLKKRLESLNTSARRPILRRRSLPAEADDSDAAAFVSVAGLMSLPAAGSEASAVSEPSSPDAESEAAESSAASSSESESSSGQISSPSSQDIVSA